MPSSVFWSLKHTDLKILDKAQYSLTVLTSRVLLFTTFIWELNFLGEWLLVSKRCSDQEGWPELSFKKGGVGWGNLSVYNVAKHSSSALLPEP